MTHLKDILAQSGALFTNLFQYPDWRNIVDVVILTVLIYQVIKLVMHTRSSSLFKGIAAILIMAWAADALRINALSWLLSQIISMGFLVIFIVFQPELRRALEQLGRSKIIRKLFGISSKPQKEERVEQNVSEIVRALNNMSRKKIGALMVFERQTGLGDVIESGTRVDAEISAPLIENIFEPNTPLHDGAVIVCSRRITAAACILPLTDDNTISRELGTRHRAAIGITETTDAVSLIVSEETGIISMAREGKLTRHLDAKSLTILLTELIAPAGNGNSWRNALRREGSRNEA